MKVETKVGLLALVSLIMIAVFAYAMGFIAPFSNTKELNVMFNFAGGIEEGSPVRVMGIKVGKVKSITFDPDYKMANGEEVKLRLTITVDKKAWTSVRKDSKFFINLAGVIGEKFLEISTGSSAAGEFSNGDYVRGEDPPRIDQLLSQGYGLAGKVIEMLEKNEGSVTNVIKQLDSLTTNFNKTLVLLDKTTKNREVARLLDNAVKISDDMAYFTTNLRSKKAEDTYDLVHKLLFRLEPLDGPAIKTFLQEEGVRARIF
ncbi:MlaD family protein [Bdellovibrio sp. SKB1291214]|uniref:MlaD family protein n=1 Tax=Bdellovibrio sp. SKB1291214 TaxID=1732569 RepID=UPI000B51AF1D|nr:MlaD family protein [Bdellovibrio sp. SKB1291214]UYL10642.1 MlaD family protein [Bdellovibrio sp. SKB1291214]